jgi:hypothetical protein
MKNLRFFIEISKDGGVGQGTMDRTRTRIQSPGQCKVFENANDDSMC